MQRISQRLALLCGGLCFLFSILLVLTGSLSSRYQLEQQFNSHHEHLAEDLATHVAPFVASVDLIGLETTLQDLRAQHALESIRVTDLDGRPLAQTGKSANAASYRFEAPVTIDRDLAAQLFLSVAPGKALEEQQGMSLGLLALAILGSLFAAALARQWGIRLEKRLQTLRGHIGGGSDEVDVIDALEADIASLPLELIMPPDASTSAAGDYQEAGLLLVQLTSLSRYVETLDENALLDYTDRLRTLVDSVAKLYGGVTTVVREFCLLVQFSGEHSAGSAAYRAVASAWLLRQLAEDLSDKRRLRYSLRLACGVGEAGAEGSPDIYPALYNQPIIDELVSHCSEEGLHTSKALAADMDVQNRCTLATDGGTNVLCGFSEPQADLLERQRRLLLPEL